MACGTGKTFVSLKIAEMIAGPGQTGIVHGAESGVAVANPYGVDPAKKHPHALFCCVL